MDLNAALYEGWNEILTESYKSHQCRLFYILLSAYAIITNAFIVLVVGRFEELHTKRSYVYLSRIATIQMLYYGLVQVIAVFADFLPTIPSKAYCYINFVTVLLLIINSILVQITAAIWMLEAKFKSVLTRHSRNICLTLDLVLCMYVMFDIAIFGINCNENNNLFEAYLLTIPVILFVNIIYKLKKSDPVEDEEVSVIPLVLCYIFVLIWLPSFVLFLLDSQGVKIGYYNLGYWVTFMGYSNGGINLSVLYIFDETFRKYLKVCLKTKDAALWEANLHTSIPV